MKVFLPTEVIFGVFCQTCGLELTAEARSSDEITVEPCQNCTEKAREEGKQEADSGN